MTEDNTDRVEENTTDLETRPSWPYPTFLFLYVVIFVLTPMVGRTIGMILFWGLLLFCFWGAVSRKQYEMLKKRYPGLSRYDYVLNNLLFPVVIPLIAWIALLCLRG